MSSAHEASGPEASRPGSGVLARMIQRSREPRSSLEPVIQPRFAPRAGGFVPGADAALGADAAPAEDSASAARPPGLLPPDARPADAVPPEARPAGALPAEALSPDVPARPPAAPAPEGAPPDALPAEAPVAVISGLPGTSRVAGSGGRSAQHLPWVVTSAPDEGLAPPDAGPPSRRARAASDGAGTARSVGREYRSEQRSYRSAAGEPGHQAGAGEPSVTITIGHIEVRAAPAPPRAPRPEAPQRPRPAFRPRTTLADFLDDGAGRPGGSGRR